MLSLAIWLPVLGAAVVAIAAVVLPAAFIRFIARGIAVASLLWAIAITVQFDPQVGTLQMQERLPWVEPLGLNYVLGVDGISLPLLLLNGLLLCVAAFVTAPDVRRPGFYYGLLLLLGGGVNGAFLSQNFLLFFLFYEVELIPLYLLIAIWGGARRGYAATKFLLYTAVSGIVLLAAAFGSAAFSRSGLDFDVATLQAQHFPIAQQGLLLALVLFAFAIKIPIVPLHTWLPDAHVEASTPISVLLAGVLLKLGTYGILRFGLGLFPDAWRAIAPYLAIWAAVSVLYGCFAAISQTDMKKMVAYSSVGHMGYILLGLAAATPLSLLGTTMQMVSHGLISSMLFLIVGLVYSKAGTRDLRQLNGLLSPERGLPFIGSLAIVAVMASAGIPGMMGFIAEFLVFRGSFAVFPVQTVLCMLGTILTAVYFLSLLDRAFFGRLYVGQKPDAKALAPATFTLPKVTWGDRAPALVLAIAIVAFGLQPGWVTRWIDRTTVALADTLAPPAAQAALLFPPADALSAGLDTLEATP